MQGKLKNRIIYSVHHKFSRQ